MKKLLLTFCMILSLSLIPHLAYADEITIDGKFNDWNKMPSYKDTMNDEGNKLDIQFVKWFPDSNKERLYLYCERNQRDDDWNFEVQFYTDMGKRVAKVSYDNSTTQTTISLYDANNTRLWNTSGTNMADKDDPKQIEFFIPYAQLMGDLQWGYLIKLRFLSGTDFAPDSGDITLSTMDTGPVISVSILIILAILVPLYLKRRKKQLQPK